MTRIANLPTRSYVARRVVFALLTAILCAGGTCPPMDGVPDLISPPDGAELDNGCEDTSDAEQWDFDWTDVPGASEYHLHVMHPGATIPIIDQTGITTSSYHREAPGNYIIEDNRFGWVWRVRAKVDGVWEPWSDERSFDVEPLNTDCVGVPTLVSPADGAELDNGCRDEPDPPDPEEWDFDWTDVPGASEYHLYAIGSGASWPMINEVGITESSYHYEGTGYIIDANRLGWTWRVRARASGMWGPWSEERSFDVEPLDTDCVGDVPDVVALLVDPLLVDTIRSGLDGFATDLDHDGYRVIEHTSDFATPDQVRDYLAGLYSDTEEKLVGAILIGDIPRAYQWVYCEWGGTPREVEFISFQYYADLDGVFEASPGYTSPGGHPYSYDVHRGDMNWEIWIGVLPLYKGDHDLTADAVNRYFEKNHTYRSGMLGLPQAFMYITEHHSASNMEEHNFYLAEFRTGQYAWTPFSIDPGALFYFDSPAAGLSVDQGYSALAAGVADFTVGDAHGWYYNHGRIDVDWIESNAIRTVFFLSGACWVGNLDIADNFLTSALYAPTSTVLVAQGSTCCAGGLGTNENGFEGHNIATALSEGEGLGAAILSHVNVPLIWPWSDEREHHFGNVAILGDPTLRVRR